MGLYSDELPRQITVEPYLVSIIALNEVENGRHFAEVREFLLWYFSRLNYPDKYGLTGTIYVYDIVEGMERPTYKYDSIDGYAGLFLHLLHRYAIKTGDLELLRSNWDKISDIAYLIPMLQDSDGLTFALPDSGIKYLMDNCEAYGGLAAYIKMQKLLGQTVSPYYSTVRDAIKSAVFSQLYDVKARNFAWAIENNYKSLSLWNRHYPDVYAQLFPLYFDLLIDQPKLRKQLWNKINREFGNRLDKFSLEQRIIYELTKKKLKEQILHD